MEMEKEYWKDRKMERQPGHWDVPATRVAANRCRSWFNKKIHPKRGTIK